MLVLQRRRGEVLVFRDAAGNLLGRVIVTDIVKHGHAVLGGRVRLGLEFVPGVKILREEIADQPAVPKGEGTT
jgi:sRNA-binding carbon storage regulator CsrA